LRESVGSFVTDLIKLLQRLQDADVAFVAAKELRANLEKTRG
jgi:hypothetical protein